MSIDRPEPAPGSAYARYGARIIAEKIRILRLIRALDRAGVNPKEHKSLHLPLARLAEFDSMLTAMLELFDRTSGAPEDDLEGFDSTFLVAEDVRGRVVDALESDDQDRVRRAVDDVVASEPEVWHEVEAMRRIPVAGKTRKRVRASRLGGPMTEAQAERLARKSWKKAESPGLRGRAQVLAEENRPLPAVDAPLDAWFERMPVTWLALTARLHDVEPTGPDLPRRIAERVAEPAWLQRFLMERLSVGPREILASILTTPAPRLDGKSAEMRSRFQVSYDWHERVPATNGGKLRAAGLVHVGIRSDVKWAEIPPPLQAALRAALEAADPERIAACERAMRSRAAKALERVPFPDPELARWKGLDRGLSKRFERWILRAGQSQGDGAIREIFGSRDRVLRSDVEQAALFESLLFDWRTEPGAKTLAEAGIEREAFSSPDEKTLAIATAAALPTIYRVGAPRRGIDFPLTPLFPPGLNLVANDRQMSLTVEQGWLIGARVYPAGAYRFVRLLGDPVTAEREPRLMRALVRAQQEFKRAGGDDDAVEFVRAHPQTLIRVLRDQRV